MKQLKHRFTADNIMLCVTRTKPAHRRPQNAVCMLPSGTVQLEFELKYTQAHSRVHLRQLEVRLFSPDCSRLLRSSVAALRLGEALQPTRVCQCETSDRPHGHAVMSYLRTDSYLRTV